MSVGTFVYQTLANNTDVAAFVNDVVGDGMHIFPGNIRQGTSFDSFCSIVYNVITGRPENVMDGPAPADHELIQLDAWARDYDSAKALRDAIRVAFEDQAVLIAASVGAKVVDFYPDEYEPDTLRYKSSIGLSVWSQR